METEETEAGSTTARAKAVIRNSAGIHCRPTAVIVKTAREFNDEITIRNQEGNTANPCSAIEILGLGLDQGAEAEIEVTGPTAEECCQRLVEVLEREYDFPPLD